ncbi:MAG: sigma-70 family RNA polymerase sigma factor, partial [Clostridiales bacterium]|jgi:RNA polymerase sporulation-specific sigma factor|nr:sigma-70 family RNA polymerase sigma factor [Clostridiales bacterium]
LVKARAAAYFLTGGDREDLIQEGMIGLFKAIRGFDPDKSVGFYAFADMCVNRQIFTAIKTSSRMKHAPLNTSVSLSAPPDEDGANRPIWETSGDGGSGNPEALLISRENLRDINSALLKLLSKREYDVLDLYLQGCQHSDIAKTLNTSKKSVDNTLQRIRRKAGRVMAASNA